MTIERIVLNPERNVSLTTYIQPVGGEFGQIERRPAVLVIPGGGYHFCSDREAEPVAFAYLKAGYQAFILRYSLDEQSVWPNPLYDYEQAMALIRQSADEWHVARDRIAVVGFSAGGHLAACAATMSKHRPNAAILGYPVIDGDCVREYQRTAPDVVAHVDGDTCPCFVFATRTDNLVPAANTIHLIDALYQNEVAFESHIYSNGPHGLSTGDASIEGNPFCDRYPRWVEDSVAWLADVLGGITPKGLAAPRFGAKVNGNRERTLNLDCTLAHLMGNPAAKALLDGAVPGWDSDAPSGRATVIRLGDTLRYMGLDECQVRTIEEKLNAIDNRSGEA
ncbi:MAG: alpha/beta hydrolase [Clostridia bacterium]|nr:alpha/beta hydrolase [Clostridia bacterium]MBQ6121998.1 alpha/beta hydrolase [Clostridia bacterium]